GRFLFDWLRGASLQGVELGAGLLNRVGVGVDVAVGVGALPGGGVAIVGIVSRRLVGRRGVARPLGVRGGRRIVRAAMRGGLRLCRCVCAIVAAIRGRAAIDQRLETIVSLRWIGLGGSWRRGLKRQACCCF